MSADNGVYILRTLRPEGTRTQVSYYEYRVEHLSAVENVFWDESINGETGNLDVWIRNAEQMWKNASLFLDESSALKAAAEVLKGLEICEYGISFIYIDRVFNEKMKPVHEVKKDLSISCCNCGFVISFMMIKED